MPKWKKLGSGSFNDAYVDEEKQFVLKVRQKKPGLNADLTIADSPERSVRLWNLINGPSPPPAAEIVDDKDLGHGWKCPFISGKEPADHEMSKAVIDVFNRTGRIVVDATSKNNFLKAKNGRIFCVDIGLAVQLDWEEEQGLAGEGRHARRRGSVISAGAWKQIHDFYSMPGGKLEHDAKAGFSQTANTVKALLFIRAHRPDIYDASFLIGNKSLINKLANAYDADYQHKTAGVQQGEELLLLHRKKPIDLIHVKNACIENLNRYINSRGSIDSNTGGIKLTRISSFLRSNTEFKIASVNRLIHKIQNAENISEIKDILDTAQKDPVLSKPGIYSYLKSCLGMSQLIVKTAIDLQPDLLESNSLRRESKQSH